MRAYVKEGKERFYSREIVSRDGCEIAHRVIETSLMGVIDRRGGFHLVDESDFVIDWKNEIKEDER